MPNSWVPRPPGVTQRPPPHPPDGRADPAAAGPTGRRSTGPSTYPVGTVLGYPNPVTVFRTSPPLLPRSFSVSQPRYPCATVPNSVHTRKERARSSHFPEPNSRPLREGAEARISGPRPRSESGGLGAGSVRAPSRARARTRAPPGLRTNRALPTPYDCTT